MRFIPLFFAALLFVSPATQAQSIMDNLPGGTVPPETAPESPAKPPAATTDAYTVTDVNADVTADTAMHARDQALAQAQRSAFTQLCARLNAPDSAAKMSDDAIAALVQSFDVQSERLSAVRYIGVFTIHFKPAAVQAKLGKAMTETSASDNDVMSAPQTPSSHLKLAVDTPSLPAWAQTKRRLSLIDQVARIDVLDLGRGTSHIDLAYTGSLDDLRKALGEHGFSLRQIAGEWALTDGGVQ